MDYLALALLVLYAVSEAFHRSERTKILNRLMARDYAQFKYFEDKWQGDLKEVDRIRKEDAAAPVPPEDEKEDKVDLSEFDEAWGEEEER